MNGRMVGVLHVSVNGEPRRCDEGATVARLVDDLGRGRKGIAVAVNEEVVPRSLWETTEVEDGDRIEVLNAAQGG